MLIESIEYRIVVTEDDQLVAVYDGLCLIPESTGYAPTVLPPATAATDPQAQTAVASPPQPLVVEELRDIGALDLAGLTIDRDAQLRLAGGRAGLALLRPYDFFGEPVAQDDSAAAATLKLRGMRCLESISEIGLLAVPDALVRPEDRPVISPPPHAANPTRAIARPPSR